MAVLFLNAAMIRAADTPGLWSGRRGFEQASSPACAHAHGHGAPRGGVVKGVLWPKTKTTL